MRTVAEIFHPQHFFSRFLVSDIVNIRHLTSYHHRDQGIFRHRADRFRIDISTVFQYGYCVADVHHLFQTVRNINNADAFFFQFRYKLKENLYFFIFQKSRRLIKDHYTDIVIDRNLTDRNHRLHCDRKCLDLFVRIDIHLKFINDLPGIVLHLFPVHKSQLRLRLSAQEIIFRNAQVLCDIYMLIIRKHTMALCFKRIGIHNPFSIVIHLHFSFIRLFNTHNTFDQC